MRTTPVANTMAASMAPAPTKGSDHDGRPANPESPESVVCGRSGGTKPVVVVASGRVVVVVAIVVVVASATVVAGAVVVVVVVEVVVVVAGTVVVVGTVVAGRRVVVVLGRLVVVVVGGAVVVGIGSVVLVVSTWARAGGCGTNSQGVRASAITEMASMSRRWRLVAVTEPLLDRLSHSDHESTERRQIVSRKNWVVWSSGSVCQYLDRALQEPFIGNSEATRKQRRRRCPLPFYFGSPLSLPMVLAS